MSAEALAFFLRFPLSNTLVCLFWLLVERERARERERERERGRDMGRAGWSNGSKRVHLEILLLVAIARDTM